MTEQKLKIHIVGNGVFGTFLKEIFTPYVEFSEKAEHVFMAVPFDAYEVVAKKYANKHLINVCSIQEEPNRICQQYSKIVTGIHPMFGPRSPDTGRSAAVTQWCQHTDQIISLFGKVNAMAVSELPDGRLLTGKLHDQIMAESHAVTVHLHRFMQPVIEKSNWIPDTFLPASYKKLREFLAQFGDMPDGTIRSIEANPYFVNPFKVLNKSNDIIP
jgi:prephenate dehydrogenase